MPIVVHVFRGSRRHGKRDVVSNVSLTADESSSKWRLTKGGVVAETNERSSFERSSSSHVRRLSSTVTIGQDFCMWSRFCNQIAEFPLLGHIFGLRVVVASSDRICIHDWMSLSCNGPSSYINTVYDQSESCGGMRSGVPGLA